MTSFEAQMKALDIQHEKILLTREKLEKKDNTIWIYLGIILLALIITGITISFIEDKDIKIAIVLVVWSFITISPFYYLAVQWKEK